MRSFILCLTILVVPAAETFSDTIRKHLKHVNVTASSAIVIEALQAIEEPAATSPEELARLTATLTKEGKVQLPKSRLEIAPQTNAITLESKNAASLKAFEATLKGLDQKPVIFFVSSIVAKAELSDDRKFGPDCLQEIEAIMVDGKAQPFSHKAPFLKPELSVEQQNAHLKGLALSMSKLDGVEVLARPSLYLKEAKRGEITAGSTDNKLSLGVIAKLTAEPGTLSLQASYERSQNGEDSNLTETEVEVLNGSLVILGSTTTEDAGKRHEEFVLISVSKVDQH